MIERHNGVLKSTLNKICKEYEHYSDNESRLYVAISHALFAKNALLDYKGYSPFMCVYGKQVNVVPGIEQENVVITDPWVNNQVKSIQQVKKAYLQSAADERLAAAMKRRADTYQAPIGRGTDVMYYRDGQKSY